MRKSGSGSSILKPQKPRQPLQVVNFDSSSDEGNPPTKIKRRVSFAEKKHVKEFCHSTEQGTVWDSTYEEHDCSSKGSFQNTGDESNKKVTECISKPEEDMCIVVENNLNCSNNSSLANDELSELAMRMNEEDNNVTDMDCTSPVACTKHSDNCSLIENIPPSDIFLTSNNSPSSDIVAYNVTDEESLEIHTSPPNVHAALDVSENAVSSNIIVYRDSDEEDRVDNNCAKHFESSTCKLDKTCLQDASMELTRAIPAPITDTLMLHPHTEEQDIIQNNDEMHLNDLHTNCTTNLNNVSMEITQAAPTHTRLFTRCDSNILTHIPTKIQTCESTTCNARNNVHADTIPRAESPTIYTNDSMVLTTVIPTSANLSCTNNIPLSMDLTGGAISADDRTTFFHNISMEITKAILSRNQEGSASPIVCESVCEENIRGREVTSDSICLTKGTRFLHESMELTEAVPSPLYNERTRDAARDASLVSDTIQDSRSLAKNIGRSQIDSIHRSDCIFSDELIQDASHHSTGDVAPNKLENLIVPENKCLSTRDAILSTRSPLSSTVRSTRPSADLATSTCQINAIANQTIQDVSMEITAALPLTSHLARDVTLNKVEDDESQHSPTKNPVTQENLTVSTLQTGITHNKSNISIDSSDNSDHFDKITKLYKKNDRDSPIFQPLQENDEAPGADDNCAHERFVDTTDRTKTNLGDSLNGSNECSFLRKSLPYLENNCDLQSIDPPSLVQSEEETSLHDAPGDDRSQISTIDDRANRHVSSAQLVTNKTTESERPTESTKTLAKDNESFTLLRDRSQSINIEKSRTKYRHEGNIEETSNTENKKVSVQTIERTNLIGSQSSELTLDTTDVQDLDKRIFVSPINVTRDKVTKEVQLEQSMEHTRDYIEENIVREKSVVIPIKEKSLTEEDHFLSLSQKLVTHSERDDVIWNVYHKNVDRKMIVFGFMANSLLIATFLFGDLNCLEDNPSIRVKILSRLTDKADVLIRIVHKLLLRKVSAEMLEHHEDIFSMLDFMSQEVKLTMDFMFDLRRLSDLNLMEITYDKISFVVLSKNMNIILKITIEIKVFDELTPNDINVHYILGAVSETEVKNLIKNVKKDCQFLRRYINDVKNYVDIMEDVAKN